MSIVFQEILNEIISGSVVAGIGFAAKFSYNKFIQKKKSIACSNLTTKKILFYSEPSVQQEFKHGTVIVNGIILPIVGTHPTPSFFKKNPKC